MSSQSQQEKKPGLAPFLLDEIISFAERLGVCVAIGVGGGAISRFSKYVFPPLPELATIFGVIVAFLSIMLVVWVALNSVASLWSNKMGWPWLVAAFLIIMLAIFFVIGGLLAGLNALAT